MTEPWRFNTVNLQQIHFNVSMHRDFVVAARNIWPPCTFENQIKFSVDKTLFAICRNNKGKGERGWGWFNNIVQWTWIFCFGPRYVDALSPQFHVPVVILSPPVRIHTYEQPVISAETLLSDVCKSFILCINGKQTDCRFY